MDPLVIHTMDVGQQFSYGLHLHQTPFEMLAFACAHLRPLDPQRDTQCSGPPVPFCDYCLTDTVPCFGATGVYGFFEANRGIDVAVVAFFSHANQFGPSPFIVGISLH